MLAETPGKNACAGARRTDNEDRPTGRGFCFHFGRVLAGRSSFLLESSRIVKFKKRESRSITVMSSVFCDPETLHS